jgi:hypothetical protein
VRRISIGKLIEHSQHLRRIFPGGRYFYFIDEDFAARPITELVELAERFPKEVGLPFECLAHPARISERKLDLLTKAGLFRVRIGIETGSELTKKEIYNRHVSNEVVNRAISILGKSPYISPVYFFIYANPYEEREDILETLRLIAKLPKNSTIQAFELIFFPGSMLYDRAISDKLIERGNEHGHVLEYYGRLHHNDHHWKKKNLYLNGLLFLSVGHCNSYRIGTIPRFMFSLLIHPRVVEFNEKHPFLIEILIRYKALLFHVRYKLVQLLKKIVKDPYAIYNIKLFFIKKINSIVKPSEKTA